MSTANSDEEIKATALADMMTDKRAVLNNTISPAQSSTWNAMHRDAQTSSKCAHKHGDENTQLTTLGTRAFCTCAHRTQFVCCAFFPLATGDATCVRFSRRAIHAHPHHSTQHTTTLGDRSFAYIYRTVVWT